MNNFFESVENIKLFHKFLGSVIQNIEEGNKVNPKDINYLGEVIKNYFETYKKEEDVKEKEKPKQNKFLENILNDKYENKKIRNIDNNFYKNLMYRVNKY